MLEKITEIKKPSNNFSIQYIWYIGVMKYYVKYTWRDFPI